MPDFQQNTITNRQAVLDYIDANTGGGGGSQDLASVLAQGSSTGNQIIYSPDALSEMSISDGQVAIGCGDGINTNNYIQFLPAKIDYYSTDLNNNDNTLIEQQATNLLLQNNSASGTQVNQVTISQFKVGLENNLNGSQIQEIYVDSDSCNMRYADGINIIDVELGLTNGFRAVRTGDANEYENFIQVQFDKVHLKYNDVLNTVVREVKIDADGIYLSGVDAYDDNAAALAAGLTAGYIFKTTGAGAITTSGVLCIVE